ncbi:winged helix-turn-helix domain-containing protein [Paenirhodobacter enshiensis]|uniref:winged helix-turn-helix domain-containing protein n=1 Tax=Paenirhodobacter enshiensis TaxID=1105367 RepID=UPI003FA330E8
MELTRARLRLYYGTLPFGPGKADLLEAIRDTGSISAAGRSMGMSYKRAWSLVEEMNAAFAEPLVASARGGAHGGGAQLSQAGEEGGSPYRTLLAQLVDPRAPANAPLGARLRPGGGAEPDRPPTDADTPQ